MLKVVIVMLSGIAAGTLFRRRVIRFIPKVISVLIWVLLFFLGVEVGLDPRIIGNFRDLGAEALILTFAGLAGSMMMAWLLWKRVSRGVHGDEE